MLNKHKYHQPQQADVTQKMTGPAANVAKMQAHFVKQVQLLADSS
jgi:hypothetical protein